LLRDPNADTIANRVTDTFTKPVADTVAEPIADTVADTIADTIANPDAAADSDTNSGAADSDTNSNAYANRDTNSGAADTDTNSNAYANRDTGADSDANGHSSAVVLAGHLPLRRQYVDLGNSRQHPDVHNEWSDREGQWLQP